MGRQLLGVLYVLVMVAIVVVVDVVFLRHQFGLRLGVNIGIVVVFGAGYFLFQRRRGAQPPRGN